MQDSQVRSTSSKKWSWKKPKGKPKRPLSAYNIFYKEVRQQILKEHSGGNESVGSTGIGFGGLTKAVAKKWKDLDPMLKRPYELKAWEAKTRYKVDLSLWEKSQQDLADKDTHEVSYAVVVTPVSHKKLESRVPSLISELDDLAKCSSSNDERNELRSLNFTSELTSKKSKNCPNVLNHANPPEPPINMIIASAFDDLFENTYRNDNTWMQCSNDFKNVQLRSIHQNFTDPYEPLPLYNDGVAEFSPNVGVPPSHNDFQPVAPPLPFQDRQESTTSAALDRLLNFLDTDDCEIILRRRPK